MMNDADHLKLAVLLALIACGIAGLNRKAQALLDEVEAGTLCGEHR